LYGNTSEKATSCKEILLIGQVAGHEDFPDRMKGKG
jgi:hypothetical protein